MTVLELPQDHQKQYQFRRLRRSVQKMEAALAHQKESIETFRENIDLLGDEMASLRSNLVKLDQNLGKIKINRLRSASLELAKIMEPATA